MSTKRHSKKNRKTNNLIGANQQNLREHRKLLPNLKFLEVPIVEIEVLGDGANVLKTDNFIEKVSQYSKLPNVIQSGGFLIMRPKKTHKHRYLINPSKMNKHWNHKKHGDKHYYINEQQTNSQHKKPYNKQWVYDIPQLSINVDHKPLLVGKYPQKTCDVLQPLFTKQQQQQHQNSHHQNKSSNNNNNFDMRKLFYQRPKTVHTITHTDNKNCNTHSETKLHRQRKRKRNENDTCNKNGSKRRKLRDYQNRNNNNNKYIKPIRLPKQLKVPKHDQLFDLTQHISSADMNRFTTLVRNNQKKNHNTFDPFVGNITDTLCHSDILSISSNDTGSHSFPTSTSSLNDMNHNNHDHNINIHNNIAPVPIPIEDDMLILSTNIDPIETDNNSSFDIQLWNKILSKKETTPPITITDMAIHDNDNNNNNNNNTETGEILKLPSLDLPQLIPSTHSPPLHHHTKLEPLLGATEPRCFNGDIICVNNIKRNIDIEMQQLQEEEDEDIDDVESYRGFAFVVNQFDEQNVAISSFWQCNTFEQQLLSSPYDNASAEDIPLIFAHDLLNNNNGVRVRDHERYYGIIGNNITLYDETSPLDLINTSLYGPFAEFKEGGRDNEYMDGVHSPYIYLGNRSTWFAWHREDMNLYAVNHLLWGSHKLWYCIAPKDTPKVLEYVRLQYAEYCSASCSGVNNNNTNNHINADEACWTPLQHKQFWFDPYILLSMGIDVYFFRQQPGDIMVTPPGGLHAGLNTGPNMAESLNFMTYDIACWRTCLSAMHFALFNNCAACLNSVWINFNALAHRCRNSEKCSGLNKRYAPHDNVVAYYHDESENSNICEILNAKQRESKRAADPISQSKGQRNWIYPIRRDDSKYWYPAVWIEVCYSWDSLQFEMLYTFKYLDSGTKKGRNNCEHFTENNVLWDKGLLVLDWNRKQRFELLTEKDKRKYPLAKKYSYPRRQGNMLLNYSNLLKKDYVNMYYQKNVYYSCYPNEIKYKDLHKKNWKNLDFRSCKQMMKDIDKHHNYFMKVYEKKKKKKIKKKKKKYHKCDKYDYDINNQNNKNAYCYSDYCDYSDSDTN